MGIYTSGQIFGIRIYRFLDDEYTFTLFEEKQCEIMSPDKMREVYSFYDGLHDKNKLGFKIFTEVSCTSALNAYNNKTFMLWYPLSLEMFLKLFDISM